ncbi:MAG: hypothetical protein QG657_997, partial [Acidobacteriota bacterium]|nr:hypothetical protein [Acidobacteriota bacterium]
EEKNRILYDFNDSEMTYPREKTIHQLFEEQSAKIPDNIAVAGPSLIVNHESFLHITYRELNKKSNLLVQVLQHNGGDPETPPFVGIIMKPFTEMITGIIGILKFGGAYLPIDPGYPQERIDYMLKDSGAKLLVTTNDKEVEKVRSWEGEQILLEFITHHSNQLSIHHSSFDIPRIHHSSRLAYLIYTSGTTGKPKGVTVEHRNVVNVITWFGRLYGLKPGVHVLQMSSYTFDASIDQIFGTLIHGGSLYVIRKNMLMDMFALRRFICSRCIHVINFVPSLLYELLCSDGWERLDSLKVVISGAEKLDDEIKRRILHLDYRLFNQYGPTETTIDALVSECSKQKVNLGKPIANVKCYICDPYNNVLPIGIAGELLVSGAGVARGYLNHPELTAEKFIDFHHSITFRTGDLCRWLPDGNIEFLGRIDNQLKIRGHRIELGEIESILLNYKGIKDVLVAAHGEGRGDKCLCAYIVSSEKLTASLLREYLTGRLPDYMIPSYFVQLEKIPLNANGKINWRDLPDPVLEVGDAYVPPQNEIEEKLVDIWSDVLGIEKTKIGRDHNFFELGGNSLKLICLADRIYKEFKLDISIVAQIYNQPRIRDLAVSFIKNNLSEQPVVLLNWEREKKIFGFPDQFGFGYNYANLGALLKDYSLYSLTFIDDDDRIKRYINVITDIQPIGPYVFFGHSAAGKLTCVIAAALEKLGLEVSDIIFADCFFVENTAVGDDEEYYKGLRKGVARFLESNKSEFLLEKVFTKAVNYTKFRDNIAGLEKINANIHLIISEEIQQRISDFSNLHCWDKLTSRRTQIYNGWGRHQEMLSGSDLQKNIKIIKNILNEIDFGKKTVSKGKEI